MNIRLQIVLRDTLSCSRRKAEEFIKNNRVKINGNTACLGDKVNPIVDCIELDSKVLKPDLVAKYIYLKIYKPRGYITSLSDEKNRKCVVDLIYNPDVRLYPVGRLDYNSEGLLFITNDGNFTNNILNPINGIPKTYRVTVSPRIDSATLNKLCSPLLIDGIKTKPAKIKRIKDYSDRSVVSVMIYEGKNRQIRKMFGLFKYRVLQLKRIKIGDVGLSNLKPGEYKHLTLNEIKSFDV